MAGRDITAVVASIIGSLAACTAIVAIGISMFRATRGYERLRLLDNAKLTVAVTTGSLAPDAWIPFCGDAPEAVLFLVVMHLAVVAFPGLVWIASERAQHQPELSLDPSSRFWSCSAF